MSTHTRIFHVTTILLLSFCLARAEDPVRFGIRVGMDLGYLSLPNDTWQDDSALHQSPIKGLIVGAFFQARISSLAYFVPQLVYIHKGTRVHNISFDAYPNGHYMYIPRGSIQIDAEYIELSTKFMSKFGWEGFNIYPNIGPLIGINLSSQTTYEYSTGTTPTSIVTVKQNKYTTPIEIALEIGIAAEIMPSQKTSYVLNWNYSFGLTNYAGVSGFPQGNALFQGSQISLGMSFAL